jgi:lipopolysaccharide transport system ATP-binding protein
MSNIVLSVENVWKQYRLGTIGTGTLKDDLARFWAKLRGKEDPTTLIGQTNDRNNIDSEYVWALQNINFEVKQGEVLGIIGKNGAGKSTLLKILSKVTQPTKGNIKVKGRIASLLEVGTGFHPELTGTENVYLNGAILGMTKNDIKNKFEEIVEFSGIGKYIDTPVKRYSSGMYVRLAFAVAAHLEPEILVLDEVLAVGDAEFQKKCLGKMKDVSGEGRTVLFVSHNMDAVRKLCTQGLMLKYGQVSFFGNMQQTIDNYLKKTDITDYSNDIPQDFSVHNTGEARFKRIMVFNQKQEPTIEFKYKEPIKVILQLEVYKEIINGILDIKICTPDNQYITYSTTVFEKIEHITLAKGIHQIECILENNLMPQNYCFAIGVHYAKGDSIDYIEGIYPFSVIKYAHNKEEDYPLAWSHGFLLEKSQWKIDLIA